jgi:hypothetical protein
VSAGRAVEPVTTELALGIGEALLLLALRALSVHFFLSDVILKEQATLGAHFGITSMVGRLTARSRADEDRVTSVTPVFPSLHLFAYRALFHCFPSIVLSSELPAIDSNINIINSEQNFQYVFSRLPH